MPSKNSKDFLSQTLVAKTLPAVHRYVTQVASDQDHEPESKRQRTDQQPNKYAEISKMCKELQKHKVLSVGLKETLKIIQSSLENKTRKVLVFGVHDKEHD